MQDFTQMPLYVLQGIVTRWRLSERTENGYDRQVWRKSKAHRVTMAALREIDRREYAEAMFTLETQAECTHETYYGGDCAHESVTELELCVAADSEAAAREQAAEIWAEGAYIRWAEGGWDPHGAYSYDPYDRYAC